MSALEKPETLPREVWVLVAANFVIAIGFGLVAPALPTFARRFDVSVTAASVVVSAFAVARLVIAPAAGALLGRIGERRVYLTGLMIVAASTGACAFANEYWQLVTVRALGGIGSTMFTVSGVALLVHLTPSSVRGKATGLWGTSFLLGTVVGPLVGGGLITISLRAPFIAYAGALIVAILIVWLSLRGSTLISEASENPHPELSLRVALRDSGFRAALASNFANGWAAFGVRVSLVPLFITEVLDREDSFAGTALAVFAAGNVAMLMVSGRLSDRWGRKPPVLIGLVVAGVATMLVGYSTSVPMFLLLTAVAGLGTGILSPPQSAAVADVIGSKARGGQVLAAFQMVADIGAILGPVIAGVLADQLSYTASFLATGSLLIVAALVWLPARETLPRDHGRGPVHPTPAEAIGAELP
ncbi:MAG TPA: MFS transporter [Actinokineospora sp.]|nr:MFS transporter [Actinokineospora sp.]